MARVLKLLAALLLSSLPALAAGTTYHVRTDGSNSTCNGLANFPASHGNPCAFATPAGCVSAMATAAGDDCTIHAGTYTGTCNTSTDRFSIPIWDFTNKSGSSGGADLAVIGAATGESVTVCQGTGTTCWDQAECPVIGSRGDVGTTEWQVFQNMNIHGYIRIGGAAHGSPVRNIRVTGNNITGGGNCDGNFQMVGLYITTNVTVDHNWIHDTNRVGTGTNPNCCASGGELPPCEPCCTNGHWSGIKLFGGTDTIMEFNTIEDLASTPATGSKFFIDDKDCSVRPIIRYNDIKDGGMRWNTQQGNCHGESPSGLTLTGNIMDSSDGNIYIQPETGGNSSMGLFTINSNTFGHFIFWPAGGATTPPSQMIVRDNIWNNKSNGYMENMPSGWFSTHASWIHDYNRYLSGGNLFHQGSTDYTTPTAWGTAIGGTSETHSFATLCNFVSAGTDWHLRDDTNSCISGNSGVGGVTQLGAYGITSCVGWLCGAAGQTCGNNAREGTEVCDGTDLGGATCASQGFVGGTLLCNGACTALDPAGCYNAFSKRSTFSTGGGVTIK